jgi:hypothetical protein
MTRLALNDETQILNRLGDMEAKSYYGKSSVDDVMYSVKTIRG